MGKPRAVLKEAAEPDSQDEPGITSFELCRSLKVRNSKASCSGGHDEPLFMNHHKKRDLGQREQKNNFIFFLFAFFCFLRKFLVCSKRFLSERENWRV